MINMGKPSSFVFLFLLHFFATTLASTGTNITTDKFVLHALKSSITSDPYDFLANWSFSSSPCNWVGVTCNTRHGRIHSLNLGGMELKGTISPQLGNLSFLVELDLSDNNFYGQIPGELVGLRRLKLFNLSYNDFEGQVPAWIGDLYSLEQLNLRNNSFNGFIPLSLFNLSRLETLDLIYNLIEGNIPFDVGRLEYLKILRLGGNKLSGIIPQTISNLTSLELLSLSYNSLSGAIPNEIGDLQQLQIILLSNNQLSNSIPNSIFNSSVRWYIELNRNNLYGSLPTDLCFGLPKLETFYVHYNYLSGEIPSIWHQCKELVDLELGDNIFNPRTIPNEIGNLTSLQTLYLANSNLQGGTPSFLWNMSSLRYVGIGRNHLKGNLPKEMCYQLPLLEVLDVDSNQFEGSILPSISNCTSLKRLRLDFNSFTGFVPKEIGNLDELNVLDLSNNHLKGHIPSNIFNISSLTLLNLGGNYLSSLLPSYLGIGIPNLETLWLDENELTGQIPNSISYASQLITIDLSFNKFSGAVPNVIGNLTNLIELTLDGNDLIGLIPAIVSKLHSLQHLSLSNNRLQGSIINELCQLKSLNELHLANNMFSGVVPGCLGNITSLQELNFSSNKLTSHIPSSLWTLKDVLVLDISSNSLSGIISPEVSNLRAITLLNLSRNQISGSIPTTMGSLQTLQTLSLAHNKLQGPIPESLRGMINIESMDLSYNCLSGVIPKSLESLLYLKYINLSYNLLDGEIPNGGPFQNFTAQSFMMNKHLCGKSQLQVQPCRKGNKHISNKVMLMKCLLPILVIILVVSGIVFLKHKRDDDNYSTKKDLINLDTPTRISYYELLQGTNGFDESNLLGFGSFGSVYKAILRNQKIVAVKVFNLDMEEALRSFDIECATMCNLRHRNLIKIISSCSNDHFKSLIMEFMPNGSLDKWLYSHNYYLDILQRLNIMIDVGSALEYLHHDSPIIVVHCDVKPSNILLDEDMVAHLSDFGIAKLFGERQMKIYTKTLATIGYMAPEYGSEGVVSTKGDVYSYGILLMEMFTRKKPKDEMFVEGLSLKDWVSKSTPHSIMNIVDTNLLQGENQDTDNILHYISSVFELALNCCINLPEARLPMTNVVVSLKKIKALYMENARDTSIKF